MSGWRDDENLGRSRLDFERNRAVIMISDCESSLDMLSEGAYTASGEQ